MNGFSSASDPDPEPKRTWRFLLPIFLWAFFAFPAGPVSAQAGAWRMERFDAELDVREDGLMFVRETIEADFLVPRHGIYRYVPYKGRFGDGRSYRLGVRLLSVTDESGRPHEVRESRSGGNVVWRIGDPRRTMTGRETYVIAYEVRGAVERLADRDELSWNVTGHGWDVPLPKVKATATYPALPAAEVAAACYHGPQGATDQDKCFVLVSDAFAGFGTLEPGEPMTVSVAWPKGHLGEPAWYMHLAYAVRDHWHFGIPFLFLAFYWAAWREYGDDETGRSVVPEYEPPKGLRPAQLMTLMKQHARPEDLAPTLIDLAVRGYVRIVETEKKLVFTVKDHELHLLKPADGALEPYERELLEKLFAGGERVKVSSLRNTFYKHVPAFTGKVMDSLAERGYFDAHPNKVRAKWIGAGLAVLGAVYFIILKPSTDALAATILLGAGFMVLLALILLPFKFIRKEMTWKEFSKPSLGLALMLLATFLRLGGFGPVRDFRVIVSVCLAAAIVLGFGWFMPRWTHEGAAAERHARGFKMFVRKVEKYRAPWMEDSGLFEKVLPYAMAFGLGKKWAAAFAGLHLEPPSWYAGVSVSASPVAFEKSLSSMASSFASATGSSPSSGGGGGGSSGGGRGGGGGGSW